MRRIFTLFIIALLPLSLLAQSGSGTSGDPYYGTITSSVTWDPDSYTNGEIYVGTASVNDLTIGNGGHLTIWPGATIIFTQPGSDLIITGTGQITADAVPANKITFTKASGNDNWGHISFQSMGSAGASVFDYCIIEYGDVTGSTSEIAHYGGALHIDFSNITISNCEIKNNKAGWGGAIFVNKGKNPTISRCIISNNSASVVGGGLYFWENTSSEVTNCIIESNNASNNVGGGGVFLGNLAGNVKIVNTLIVNNNSPSYGKNIRLFQNTNTSKPQFINCVIWGSSNPIAYSGQSPSANDFINCAVSEYIISSYTYCIALNSNNSASDGPNFNATDGSDWSIKFISPCRDSGTDSGAPSNDFDGNGRVYTTDIGAYEVQYSRWDGSEGTSWGTAGNWEQNISPGSSGSDVIIPSGLASYPTSGTTNFEISSGRTMIVEPGARATFNILTNTGGTFRFLEDATGSASVIFGSFYSDSGSEELYMYLTGGGGPDYRWHYIAVPATIDKTVFTNINPYNLLSWDDSKIVDDKMQGWQWHDGYDGTTGFSSLSPMQGYNFYHTAANVTVSLPEVSSLLTTMGSSVSLQYNGDGLNLLGNSLTCSINWDDVSLTGNMRDAIYFTKDNQMVSYVNGVGSPSGTTGIIPPLQGFFVKALEPGCSIDFTGTKTHGNVIRYKGNSIIPLIRFQLNRDQDFIDETVIRFDYDATDKIDNRFDAEKLFISRETSQIYSELEGEKYVINGICYPYETKSLPLTIKITEPGNYKINRTEIKGLDHYDVSLTDTYENFTINLKDIDHYNFSSGAGLFSDRFIFTISTFATGLNDITAGDREFNIYTFGSSLNIEALSQRWDEAAGTVNIYDLTGRRVQSYSGLRWSTGEVKQLGFDKPYGIYIVEITGGVKRVVQKISHR